MSYDASYSDAQHWLISLIVQSLSPHCYCSNAHSQTCQSSVVSFWQMTHSFHLTHIFCGTHWSLNMTFVTQIVFSNDFHYDLIITLLAMSSRGRGFHWRLGELLAMSITHISHAWFLCGLLLCTETYALRIISGTNQINFISHYCSIPKPIWFHLNSCHPLSVNVIILWVITHIPAICVSDTSDKP